MYWFTNVTQKGKGHSNLGSTNTTKDFFTAEVRKLKPLLTPRKGQKSSNVASVVSWTSNIENDRNVCLSTMLNLLCCAWTVHPPFKGSLVTHCFPLVLFFLTFRNLFLVQVDATVTCWQNIVFYVSSSLCSPSLVAVTKTNILWVASFYIYPGNFILRRAWDQEIWPLLQGRVGAFWPIFEEIEQLDGKIYSKGRFLRFRP